MRKIVSPEEKKLKEARSTVKVMPLLAAFAGAFLVVDAVGLASHPDVPHLLRLMMPIGMVLYAVAHRRKALLLLAGGRSSWEMPLLLMGLLMMASGPILGDMYGRGLMASFLALGVAVLVIEAVCLVLLGLELAGIVKAVIRARSCDPVAAEEQWYRKK